MIQENKVLVKEVKEAISNIEELLERDAIIFTPYRRELVMKKVNEAFAKILEEK